MRSLAVLLLLPLAPACQSVAPPEGPDITSNLALWLPFSRTLDDASGNRNSGTSPGASYTADRQGRDRSAYRLRGLSSVITVASNTTLDPADQMTLCFWLRVDSITDDYMPIVTKGGPVWGYFGNREYGVWAKQNYERWFPQFKSAGDSSGMHELDSDNRSFTVGEWNFFAFVVDRARHTMRFYADGILTKEIVDTYSSFNTNTADLLVGWDAESLEGHSPLCPTIDNLRVYTRALTPEQISYLHASCL
jgi:hypothetical protein